MCETRAVTRVSVAIIVLLCCVQASPTWARPAGQVGSDMQPFEKSDWGLTMEYPADWIAEAQDDVLKFTAADYATFYLIRDDAFVDMNRSLTALAASALSRVHVKTVALKVKPQVGAADRREAVLSGIEPTYWIGWVGFLVQFVKGDQGYVILTTAVAKTYADHEGTFMAMARSLKFQGDAAPTDTPTRSRKPTTTPTRQPAPRPRRTATPTPAPTPEMKLFQKPDWGLVVPYPAAWQVIDEATYVSIAISVTIGQSRLGAYPMDVNADFEFTVAQDPSYTNPEANLFSILKDVVVTKEGQPADQLKDLQMADSPARTVDGRDARAATFSGSAEYWDIITEVTGEIDLLSVGEQGYAIVSRGPSGAWPQYREALQAMLEGMRFDGPTEGESPPAK